MVIDTKQQWPARKEGRRRPSERRVRGTVLKSEGGAVEKDSLSALTCRKETQNGEKGSPVGMSMGTILVQLGS